MSHFVYAMKSTDKAPAGDGTTATWFKYYKWDVDDETYVPYQPSEDAVRPVANDVVWFVEDLHVLGCAKITKVVEGALHDRLEIWYDTRELQDFLGQRTVSTAQPGGVVTDKSSIAFFEELKKRMDVLYKPRSALAQQAEAVARSTREF